MTTLSTHARFRLQHQALRTLWTDDQVQTLEDEILSALERELGPTEDDLPRLPLQHAVGWISDGDISPSFFTRSTEEFYDFSTPRACDCLWCGQRFVWKPTSTNVCACSYRCAKKMIEKRNKDAILKAQLRAATEAKRKKDKEKRQDEPSRYKLVPDMNFIRKASDTLQQQLSDHGVDAKFVMPHCVHGKWTVLQYTDISTMKSLFIVLNSRPGRASWSLTATSAEQAVQQLMGLTF
jgi:hypothetical protein